MKFFLSFVIRALYACLFAFFVVAFVNVPFAGVAAVAFFASYFIPRNVGLASAFVTLNNVNEREVYHNAVQALGRAFSDQPGFDARNYKLTQSYLRLEQAIVAGVTTYRFPVLINETSPAIFNTEKRLNLQDSFVTSSIFIGLAVPAGATDTAFLPVAYPDPLQFAAGTTAVDARALYSGSMQWMVNNDVLTPDWDVYRHYSAPVTQAAAAIPGVTPATVNSDSGNAGFYPMEPNLVLVGAKNNKISINLPAGIATVQTNSRIVMILRGVLAQNTTVVS